MLAQIRWSHRGWGRARWEQWYGIPVLMADVDPDGAMNRYCLARAGKKLARTGAVRTLAPRNFSDWDRLEPLGLKPVDPGPLVRRQAAGLALKALERAGKDPERSIVTLSGNRADREMAETARKLCGRVRRMAIAAPRGGEELAIWLRDQYGMPILPPEEPGELTLCFAPGGSAPSSSLLLYGREPELGGLTLCAPCLREPDRSDLAALTVLWECGKLAGTDLNIT